MIFFKSIALRRNIILSLVVIFWLWIPSTLVSDETEKQGESQSSESAHEYDEPDDLFIEPEPEAESEETKAAETK